MGTLESQCGCYEGAGQAGPDDVARQAGQRARVSWAAEPHVGRVAHGLPKRLVASHLHALGNAVVPQVAETVGRLIVAADTTREVSR